jgi:hypothetical protein
MKRGVSRWNAAIDGRLQQDFLDLISRDAVVEGGANMQPEFVGSIQRHHHRHGDQAPRMSRQSGAGPDFAPRIARDQLLEVLVERIPFGERAIDVQDTWTRARLTLNPLS